MNYTPLRASKARSARPVSRKSYSFQFSTPLSPKLVMYYKQKHQLTNSFSLRPAPQLQKRAASSAVNSSENPALQNMYKKVHYIRSNFMVRYLHLHAQMWCAPLRPNPGFEGRPSLLLRPPNLVYSLSGKVSSGC